MYRRQKPAPAAPRLPAAVAMMAAEVEARPFGVAGEWLSGGQAAPAPPPPQPFTPPPPDWNAELRERREREASIVDAAPGPQVTAVERMLGDDGREPGPPPGPALTYEPMLRFVPPAPDWRAEEEERQRQRAGEAQQHLEPA